MVRAFVDHLWLRPALLRRTPELCDRGSCADEFLCPPRRALVGAEMARNGSCVRVRMASSPLGSQLCSWHSAARCAAACVPVVEGRPTTDAGFSRGRKIIFAVQLQLYSKLRGPQETDKQQIQQNLLQK